MSSFRVRAGVVSAASLLVLLALAPGASARDIQVPQQQPTIQDAVDAADPGDRILVQGRKKRYFENVEVTTNRLTILGLNRKGREAVVDGSSRDGTTHDLVFDIDAHKVMLRNLRAQHGNGIDCTGARCRFVDVIVNMSDHGGDCIEIDGKLGVVERSRFQGCDDNAVDVDGDRYRILRNTILQIDNDCTLLDGDQGRIANNEMRICEDGEAVDLEGNSNEIRGNFAKSADANIIEADGNRNQIIDNRVANSDDTSGCIEADGIAVRVRDNVARSCSKGYDVEGENPRVVDNRAVNSPEDNGYEISCFDETGGEPEADACVRGVIRGNVSAHSGDDDESFSISDSGSDGGLTIEGNVSRDGYEEGFDLDVDRALIARNVSRRDGAEGNESGFDICGERNRIVDNRAINSGEDGIQVSCGNGNRILRNLAKFANLDGIHLEDGNNGTIRKNRTFLNSGDGIENDGTNSRIVRNVSFDNRRDCANDGTIAEKSGNRCADGSNFQEPGGINRVAHRRR